MTAEHDWITLFPALQRLDPQAARTLREATRMAVIPPGTTVFQEGGQCANYILVLDGSVRVQKVSESGREIVLYRVDRGQTCVLTTNCLMTQDSYGAEGVTETEVQAVLLPEPAFQALLARSAEFRNFVFGTYATRISELLMLIEEVAFGRIDMRLAQCLLDQADAEGLVKGTHQDLAVELGTAREVVSRQLKEFERRGWLALHRGRVQLLDRVALRDLARRERN